MHRDHRGQHREIDIVALYLPQKLLEKSEAGAVIGGGQHQIEQSQQRHSIYCLMARHWNARASRHESRIVGEYARNCACWHLCQVPEALLFDLGVSFVLSEEI